MSAESVANVATQKSVSPEAKYNGVEPLECSKKTTLSAPMGGIITSNEDTLSAKGDNIALKMRYHFIADNSVTTVKLTCAEMCFLIISMVLLLMIVAGWIVGLLDCWLTGWLAGWLDSWIVGLLDCWLAGWLAG